jgi:hypothetical protein
MIRLKSKFRVMAECWAQRTSDLTDKVTWDTQNARSVVSICAVGAAVWQH